MHQFEALDRLDGDIDALSSRLARVRTLAYVAHRGDWLDDAGAWQERARALSLDMKVSLVDFSLSGKKATFYFTSDGRVDFRQLVRDLSSRFSVRVKMVQVGARDEAGLIGGIGICGRTLCCSTWLKDFRPISIQMAKRQNLSLNPSKISGQCGRLLCCLAYEDEGYKKGNPDTRSAAPATA